MTRKIFSAIFVCFLLVGLLPFAALADGQAELATVQAWNLVLADEIAANFCVSIPEDAVENAVMEITVGDAACVYPAAQAMQNPNGTYLFTARLAAAQMNDAITLKLFCGENVHFVKIYSVVQYAQVILSGNYSEDTIDLVRSMLSYGTAAQTPDLPTATVSEIENDELTFALNFTADTATAAKNCWYGIW